MMKKAATVILTCITGMGLLAGCGAVDSMSQMDTEPASAEIREIEEEQVPTTDLAAPAGDVFVMRIGHAQSEESARHRTLLMFEQEVEEKTEGKVQVEIYPCGELGGETEMTDMVEWGELEAVRGGDLEYVPKTTMLGLPMIADDLEQIQMLCNSTFVRDMLRTAETDHNMKVLAVGDDSGFRQFTNNVREIRKPEDMIGLKMRTVLEVIDLSLQEFGASTASIPFTELYDALASGRVDGQENPLAVIDANKLYEVQKYCTIIDYMFFAELMYVNLDWWNSLPETYQGILTSAARSMMEENARITESENEQYIRDIKAHGMKVITLTEEERAAFQPLAENVWRKYVETGRISREELDELLSVVGKSVDW
ncbi:MAG: TRAP transporter substrate-binding protein [Butyrivibrio sp.]|nr:TRAP transporter substrate-binding protein [Butyrivibrio sp.]